MSLDRRIVSILYFNGINDVNKVERFIGEKDNFYEIMIDGKIEKLKIPGYEYFEIPSIEHLETQIKQLDKNIEKLESFTNNLEEVVEHIKESKNFTSTIVTETKETQEKIENIKKSKKSKSPKLSDKKIEIVETKKLDDELDDFINTI